MSTVLPDDEIPRRRVRDVVRRVWAGRDDMLALWPPDAFSFRVYKRRFLFREVVVVNEPDAVRHVLASNAANYRKSALTQRVLEPLVGDGMFISEGELWARQRRIATPAFHRSRLRRFAEQMVDGGERMLERWAAAETGGEPLDLGEEMSRVTMEVVASTMFGDDLSADDTATVFHAFGRYQETLGRLDVAELCGLPRWLPPLGERAARRAVVDMDRVINGLIARRLAEQPGASKRDDLLQLFAHAEDPETGERMTPKLLRDEVSVMILAGHETTANTLTWAFWLLSQHRDAEARLHAEVDAALGTRRPTYDDLDALPFARAVIDETLRLYPPVHIFSRDALGPDRIGKFDVEPGTMAVVSPWLLHRHRRWWPRPDEFVPERFMDGGEGLRADSQFAYLPFGAGPRTCLGKHFGLAEATLLLALVARRYRLVPPAAHLARPVGRLTIRPRDGLPVQLQPRADGR